MGQVVVITPEQKLLLDEFGADSYIKDNFYFTGGTALAFYYLKHRISVDLDFFSEKEFNTRTIFDKITALGKKYHYTIDLTPIENTQTFNLIFPNMQSVKVDFAHYPYKRLAKGMQQDGITIDSLLDIAANKLLVIQQRNQVKDFVDLYFLLKQFTVWDLMEGVKQKFGVRIDPLLVASDFLKVERFEFLPQMIVPLGLDDLKEYYIKRAQDMGLKETSK